MVTTPALWLEDGLTIAQDLLAEFAQDEAFETKLKIAFGTALNTQAMAQIQQALLYGDDLYGDDLPQFDLPQFEIVGTAALQGAWAAYDTTRRTVYVSDSFLSANRENPGAIASVLLEEIGHDWDTRLNPGQDAEGDEGAIFSALVQSQPLSEAQLQQLKGENDWATIQVNGIETWVEMATTDVTGGGQAVDNRQPFATLNYAIAFQGIFPPRNLSADHALTTGESTPYIGEVIQFAGNFAPRGYALANGQILSIAQNTALFATVGTTFGGDGISTFALPDLRGRAPIGTGIAPGGNVVDLGQIGGSETVTLTSAQLPAHSHLVNGSPTDSTGGGQSVSTLQPTLGLTPVITVRGSFGDLGHIGWFAGNFVPRDHAIANGQLLSINQNLTLFNIIGNTYGGDGVTTFALPNLQGRIAVGSGATRPLGSAFGSETVTLTSANLPAHSHTVAGANPSSSTGGGQPFSNLQPSLALSYEIAQRGVFPSRNLQAEAGTPDGGSSGEATDFVSSAGIISKETALAAIQDLAQVGIGLWQAAGISGEQLSQLTSVTYQIADLEPGYLAVLGEGNVITIDADASQRRWFVDATPEDHQEFGSTDPSTGELLATDASALGSFDLLTVILHEQGHRLGLGHVDAPGSLMSGSLGTGGRFLPSPSTLVPTAEDDHASPFFSVTEPTLAQVNMFAGPRFGNFRGDLLPADGQLLSIAQNSALFSLVGDTYGGDGLSTFAVPDLRDRTVLHAGQGPGLSNLDLGQVGGSATTTLSLNQMPAHSHNFPDPVNLPPIATNDSGFTAIQGIAQTIPVALLLSNDSDPEGASLRVISVGNASTGVVALNDNGTANLASDDFITFTPSSSFTGDATFQYTISDGVSNANAIATVTVNLDPNGNPGGNNGGNTGGNTGGNNGGNTGGNTGGNNGGNTGNNVLTGTPGNDTLTGGNTNDQLTGGLGADLLTGGGGGDRYLYSGRSQRQAFSNSLVGAPDRIIGFQFQEGDRIQLDYDNNLATIERPRKLYKVGRVKAKTLAAAVRTAYEDKRSNKPGQQPLAANEALFFRWGKRTYLSVNDRNPAFSGGRDLVINMTGTPIPGGSVLPVERYFV
jgi:microcystin-dependent protein